MLIRFLKGKDKKDTLTITRKDGSVTWTTLKESFGPEHDICHFVVEEELEFTAGFYGLVASGMNIEDFENTSNKEWLGPEGLWAESVVMALQYERRGIATREALPDLIASSCNNFDLDPPSLLNGDTLDDMRFSFDMLMKEWEALHAGETLELEWS